MTVSVNAVQSVILAYIVLHLVKKGDNVLCLEDT